MGKHIPQGVLAVTFMALALSLAYGACSQLPSWHWRSASPTPLPGRDTSIGCGLYPFR